MITNESIEEVKEKADLVDLISPKYTKLTKKGANYIGKSPFVEEKTGSFVVSPTKGVYKCFSSGKGGNSAISFLMDKEGLDFVEAVRFLADKYNVQLEETKPSEDETPEKKLKRAEYIKINRAAARRYVEILMDMQADDPVMKELAGNRALTLDTLINFQIGFAPDKESYVRQLVTEKGLFNEALELGLIKLPKNSATAYDYFRNRIMFPIHNERGEIVGFGGRTMTDGNKYAKYLNSQESLIYKKDRVLYGLYQAIAGIKKLGFAVGVEGYFDVISFHQGGVDNTVAPCGTAWTEGQVKLLKRFTSHIVLMGDGDAAGQKSNLKAVDLFLKANFKVDIVELPKKEDPDSFARKLLGTPEGFAVERLYAAPAEIDENAEQEDEYPETPVEQPHFAVAAGIDDDDEAPF